MKLPLLLLVFACAAAPAQDHPSWKLPGGATLTGTIESAGARGVRVKREDGNVASLAAKDMTVADRERLNDWLLAKSIPAEYAKPDHAITITTKAGSLAYDLNGFGVKPGALVALTLDNHDQLQHNIVVCSKPSAQVGQDVAMTALKLGVVGFEREWVPQSADVLVASRMANPKQKIRVFFRAPSKEADYAYVCTFPGHAQVMKGLMTVGSPATGDEGGSGRPGFENLRYSLYKGNWNKLPNFAELKPVKQGPVKGTLFDVASHGEREGFGVVYTADITAPKNGKYRFALASDDGSRLLVDGKIVIDLDGIHGMTAPKSADIELSAGEHKLVIEYFERSGEEELYASWKGPTLNETPFAKGTKRGGRSNNATGIPLYPLAGEAMIYRNFIDGVGGARGIAVGFSAGVHLAYDAENGRIAMMWRGGFMDAKRHWSGRGQGFQPPAGTPVKVDPRGQMLAVLDSPNAEWPKDDYVALAKSKVYTGPDRTPSAYQFDGYELDDKRQPTFHWHWNGVRVRDYPVPAGGGFARRMQFTGKVDATGFGKLYLRLANGAPDGVEISVKGARPIETGTELRVPIDLSSGEAEITVQYSLK